MTLVKNATRRSPLLSLWGGPLPGGSVLSHFLRFLLRCLGRLLCSLLFNFPHFHNISNPVLSVSIYHFLHAPFVRFMLLAATLKFRVLLLSPIQKFAGSLATMVAYFLFCKMFLRPYIQYIFGQKPNQPLPRFQLHPEFLVFLETVLYIGDLFQRRTGRLVSA